MSASLASSFYFTRGQHILALFSLFWRYLCIKAVNNLKAKSLGIILTQRAMFLPVSAFR